MPGISIAEQLESQAQNYRKEKFTGVVKVNSGSSAQWQLYFLLGRIVWSRSRIHAVRRWQRHLSIYSPVFFAKVIQSTTVSYPDWNYVALARRVKLKKFRRDQFSHIVENCIKEDLFDLLRVGTHQYANSSQLLTYEPTAKEAADLPFVMLDQDRALQQALEHWMSWRQSGLEKCSPDWAPVIIQLAQLEAQTPPQTFDTLTSVIDGKTTLRDLAIKFKKPIIPLTKSLLPYVSRQLLKFTETSDTIENLPEDFYPAIGSQRQRTLSKALSASSTQPSSSFSDAQNRLSALRLAALRSKKDAGATHLPAAEPMSARVLRAKKDSRPMVIYIDDSPADSRLMGSIVEGLGYRYANILNPLEALPKLIELRPKLIFLDLVMPIANGYEVCAQIRRVSAFREIPIIIVTSNDGIADRVRAKVVGASGFMGKPIQEKKILKVVKKYLQYGKTDNVSNPTANIQPATSSIYT